MRQFDVARRSHCNNSNQKIATRTDAKGQVTVYTYDSLARLTEVQHYPGGVNNPEDACQQVDYSYDANPYNSGFSQYAFGRLAAVQYYGGNNYGSPGACTSTFQEMYSYNQAGGKLVKQLLLTRGISWYDSYNQPHSTTSSVPLEADYTYDNEGRITGVAYPQSSANLATAYDSMGRPSTLTDDLAQQTIIGSATYGAANNLLTINSYGAYVSETRTYNAMYQLTSINATSSNQQLVNVSYAYSATQNNGKIISQTDAMSGETVQYTYDSLNRLLTAQATSNAWGQRYSYDGFGNLTGQTVTAGSAPSYSVAYNATTNRQTTDTADGNGNIAVGVYGSTYDAENRLRQVNAPTAPQVEYSYAPGNKRVWRGAQWTGGTDGNGHCVDGCNDP